MFNINKILYYLTCLLLLAGCSNGNKTVSIVDSPVVVEQKGLRDTSAELQEVAIKPYKLNQYYTVVDTGEFDATVMGSKYAVIFRSGKLADTIDKGFSMIKINDDHYLYQSLVNEEPIHKYKNEKGDVVKTMVGSFGGYTLINGGKKEFLSDLAKNFDDYFSSPNVLNGKIYYWQMDRTADSLTLTKIFAAEFDPKTKVTKQHYLFDDDIGTDDSGYFPNPYLKGDTILFHFQDDKILKFSKDFKPYF